MALLTPTPEVIITAARQPTETDRIGLLAGALIRAAADLTVSGQDKHQAVVDAIKGALFDAGVTSDALRKWVTDMLGIGGFVGGALRGFLRLLPVQKIVEALISYAVQTAYRAMKRAGIAL